MSNPNTNALMSMLQGSIKPKKVTAAGYKIVEIGSDKFPVNVMDMASIDTTIWEKKFCFDSLSTAMYDHINNLSMPDLISTVSPEVHMDTTTAFVESDAVNKDIMESIFDVANLMGLVFQHSSGKVEKNPSSTDNKGRY